MKNTKKLVMIAMLIASVQSLFAENKTRIYVTNNYGDDVALHLTWRAKSFMGVSSLAGLNFDRHEDVTLKEHYENYEFVAPVSAYQLYEIDATPAVNVAGKTEMKMATTATQNYVQDWDPSVGDRKTRATANFADAMTDVGYAITKSMNSDAVKPRNNKTFFIVENTHKQSRIPGQNRIVIKDFDSKKHYDQQVVKTQPVVKQELVRVVSRPVAVVRQEPAQMIDRSEQLRKQGEVMEQLRQRSEREVQRFNPRTQQVVQPVKVVEQAPVVLSSDDFKKLHGISIEELYGDSFNDEDNTASMIQEDQMNLNNSFKNLGAAAA